MLYVRWATIDGIALSVYITNKQYIIALIINCTIRFSKCIKANKIELIEIEKKNREKFVCKIKDVRPKN